MKKTRNLGLWVLASFFMLISFAQSVHALPTFARKYQTSCSTCHVSVPKLTAFGESFRLNGYQIPEGDEMYLKENPVSMGAPEWSKV